MRFRLLAMALFLAGGSLARAQAAEGIFAGTVAAAPAWQPVRPAVWEYSAGAAGSGTTGAVVPTAASVTPTPGAVPTAAIIDPNVIVAGAVTAQPILGQPPPGSEPCPGRGHKFVVWGDALYWRPRESAITYGVPISGAIGPGAPPVQVGPAGMVDLDYEPGIRAGVGFSSSPSSAVFGQYTRYENTASDAITTAAPNVIRSLVVHPGTLSATADGLDARAEYSIDFELIDGEYKGLIASGQQYAVEVLVGGRYAELQQDFRSVFSTIGTTTVDTSIDFAGAGVNFGLEGERFSNHSGFSVYGRGMAHFLAGRFRADFRQTNSLAGTEAFTDLEFERIVPMLEAEAGLGWTSRGGMFHLRGGYAFTTWLNVVKTDDFIRAVQTNSFNDVEDSLSFDGAVARLEVRW